ncbi:MAG: hypothetical protein JWM93_752 [Frankiales bacterium]|nr:hypothetical protein [Frankiales bacterium]
MAAVLAMAVWAAGGPAAAHTGQGPIALLKAGPYTVQPYDAARGTNGDLQRLPLTVYDAQDHKATDVTVTLSAVDPSATRTIGPIEATPSLNGFEAQLPPAPPGGWSVTVTVTGPLGSGQASYLAHGVQQASPTSGAGVLLKVIVGVFALTILGALLVVLARGRRAEDAEFDELQDEAPGDLA